MRQAQFAHPVAALVLAAAVTLGAVALLPSAAGAFTITPGTYGGSVTANGGHAPGAWTVSVSDSGAVTGSFNAFSTFTYSAYGCDINVPISLHGPISGHMNTGAADVTITEEGAAAGSEHCHFPGTTTAPGGTVTVPIPSTAFPAKSFSASIPLLSMEDGTPYSNPSAGLDFTLTSWPHKTSSCLQPDLTASFKCIFNALTQKVWNGVPFEVSAGTTLKAAGKHALQLILGTISVATKYKRDSKLHIITPTVAVAVRGTQFEVQVKAGATTVHVFKGLVEVTSRKHKHRHALLHADEMAVASATGSIAGPKKFSAASVVQWWKASA